MAQIVAATPAGIAQAAARLRAGELVAMPTETVYGLAGNADDPQAVAKIFSTKGDRKSTRLNSSHIPLSRMPSSA